MRGCQLLLSPCVIRSHLINTFCFLKCAQTLSQNQLPPIYEMTSNNCATVHGRPSWRMPPQLVLESPLMGTEFRILERLVSPLLLCVPPRLEMTGAAALMFMVT
jgi:hypothetical protein